MTGFHTKFMSRTYKKPYSKSKRFDSGCRNHGSCNYCKDNRTHPDEVRLIISEEKLKEWAEDGLRYLAELEELEEAASESIERLDKSEKNADN